MTQHAAYALAFISGLGLAACATSPDPFGPSPSMMDAGAADATTTTAPDASEPADLAGPTIVRVHYPAGSRSLSIRGDGAGLTWASGAAMSAGSDDTWTYELVGAPARTEWKPLLDDTDWSHGANYVVRRGETVDVYPHFVSTHGSVSQFDPAFHSTHLNNDRVVWVYLPPSYQENTRARYPVLYMHDGQNLFDPAHAFGGNEWKVDEAIDTAVEGDGSIPELIVIGPEASAGRLYEYSPSVDMDIGTGGGADDYLKMLFDELKPRVDAELRTLPDRSNTGVMGSSMGGLVSAYAGVSRAAVVGRVGAMSPSTWWDGRTIVDRVLATANLPVRPERVYVDSGSPGDGYADTQQLIAAYHTIGYVDGTNFASVIQQGAMHSEVFWAMRLPAALAFLFDPR